MNAQTAREELIKIASQEIGTREVGGNNLGPRVKTYQSATWLKPGPWPWCAAFVCWVIREWLYNDPNLPEFLGVKNPEEWRPKTAGAFDYARWAKKAGCPVMGETAAVMKGDLVVFDFSHIGIVSADAPANVRIIQTIEGNTNGRGMRDSDSGDGVWAKGRVRSLAQSFIRLVP